MHANEVKSEWNRGKGYQRANHCQLLSLGIRGAEHTNSRTVNHDFFLFDIIALLMKITCLYLKAPAIVAAIKSDFLRQKFT